MLNFDARQSASLLTVSDCEPDRAERSGKQRFRPCRRTLHRSATAFVEDVYLHPKAPVPRGHSLDCQIVVPYAGIFGWTVGTKTALLDANRVLFVGAGEDFSESRPVPGVGHSSAVITPTLPIIDELGGSSDSAFREISRPASMQARLLTHRLLSIQGDGALNRLAADEIALAVMTETLAAPPRVTGYPPPQIVERAKQILHARELTPIGLDEIAKEVGASPVYLTQTFTRTEGVPLYRYQLRLRLSHALNELPQCEDITGLALDLGFSSHSHFTACFKAAFGITPSQFRREATVSL